VGLRQLLLASSIVIQLVGLASSEQAEYVITFNAVVVRGVIGLYDTPEVAHLEAPVSEQTVLPEQVRRPAPAPSASGASGPSPQTSPPRDLRGRPTHPLVFAPGQGTANPSFVEKGFLVESFWAVNTGTPQGYFKKAHFHPPDLATGFEGQHLGNPTELHGIYIRSLDGKPFGVKSLRYRVTRNRQIPRKPLSIDGFSNFNVNVLIGRTFDPRGSIRGQFVEFPVGLPSGNEPTLPWWILHVNGFEAVEHVYIASSASVDLDDIVLTRFRRAESPTENVQEE
jgi:hypothetical protein